MMTYQLLSTQPRAFLGMTGLITAEFGDLLPAFETAYERATEVMTANAVCRDAQEGMRAFLEKRRPVWKGD